MYFRWFIVIWQYVGSVQRPGRGADLIYTAAEALNSNVLVISRLEWLILVEE